MWRKNQHIFFLKIIVFEALTKCFDGTNYCLKKCVIALTLCHGQIIKTNAHTYDSVILRWRKHKTYAERKWKHEYAQCEINPVLSGLC